MDKMSLKNGFMLWLGMSVVCFASDLNVKTVPYKPVIIKQAVVSKEPGCYCGWPSIAKLPNGRLVVVYSGDRDWHVCPWGKMKMVYSDNNGTDWSDIKTVTNTPLDDRDAGLLVTAKGTILISWFTSVEFANQKSGFYKTRYAQYARHADKLNASIRQEWKGAWLRRSEDNSQTWSDPIKIPVDTPHGPIQLKDGRVLMVTGAGVAESCDDGKSWKMITEFTAEKYGKLSEVHAVELQDGKIISMSRAPYLKQFESTDGGITWSLPVETKINGYPPHLIRLKNGWLVVVYGRRSSLPNGQFACISRDGGKTWDTEKEITLSIADTHRGTEEELGYPPNWDLGYPCSVLLDDGTIWTVYYQVDKSGEWPSIMGTHWKLEISDDAANAGQSYMDGHLDAGYQAQIVKTEKTADGPRVVLGDVVVVAHAPAGEPQPEWGQWQFPHIERLADGRLYVTWSIAVDSARSYGAEPAHAVSADYGRTWTRVAYPEADQLCTGVLLANGDRLRLTSDSPLPPDQVTLPDPITNVVPVFNKAIASGDYRFFRREDFSGEMREGYPQFRMAAGSSTWVKEYPKVNLPGEVIWQREGILVRPFFMGNLRVAPDGSLWTSCYWPSLKDGTVRAYCPAFVQSTDNGHSWDFVSEIPFEPDKSKHSNWERCWGFCEPDITFAPDGSMLTLLRAGPSYIARSTDNGKHWGKPIMFDSLGALPQLLTLKNGVILASYGRPGVRVRASSDPSGMRWGDPVDLPVHSVSKGSKGASCGYTGLVALNDNEAMLVYSDFGYPDAKGSPRKSICVMSIRVE